MKYIYYTLTFFTFGCSDNQKEISDIKTNIDPSINISPKCQDILSVKLNTHSNFLFSKTFIIPPQSYNIDSTSGRFYKDNENYIQVQESPNVSFNSRKYFYTRKALDSIGTNITSHCSIKVNGYNGYRITGPLTEDGNRQKTEIIFGNNDFTTLVFATSNSPENEKEINIALETIFYDPNFEANSNEITPFKVLLDDTKFKLNSHLSNIYVYTIDGKGEPFNKDFLAPQFQIFETPYVGDTTAIKLHFGKILNGIERNGVIGIKLTKLRSFSHKSRWTYIVSKDVSFKGEKGVLYLFVTASINGNLAFLGTSYKDTQKYYKAFEKIALSLDTK